MDAKKRDAALDNLVKALNLPVPTISVIAIRLGVCAIGELRALTTIDPAELELLRASKRLCAIMLNFRCVCDDADEDAEECAAHVELTLARRLYDDCVYATETLALEAARGGVK